MTSKLMEDMDMEEPPTIKFGDASVAAPFTSKLSNVVASKFHGYDGSRSLPIAHFTACLPRGR